MQFVELWKTAVGARPRGLQQFGIGRNSTLAFWPDGGTLVSTTNQVPWLVAFRVEKDGSVSSAEDFYGPLQLLPKAKGAGAYQMAFDTDGRLYIATVAGVQIFDTEGRHYGTLRKPSPGPHLGLCFGGADRSWLYVSTGQAIYRRRVQTPGAK